MTNCSSQRSWAKPRRCLHAGLAGPFMVLYSACAGGESASAGLVARDSAGIEILESEAPAWPEGEGWRLAAEPSLSLGVVHGEAAYQFDRIRGVARLRNGGLVVAGSHEIRVYDQSGRHLVRMGRQGDGPGEFREIAGVIMIGDTIAALDRSLQRLSYFDLSGRYLTSVSLQPTRDPIHPLRMYRLGGLLGEDLALLVYAYPADRRAQPMTYWDTLPTLRYSRAGRLRDTVGEFAGMDTHSTPKRAGSITFARLSSSDVHDGQLYMTDGRRYEIRVYDPDHGLTRVLRAQREPRPATQTLLDEYHERMLDRISDPERRRGFRAEVESWPHAETLPWISDVKVDLSGVVWVREYQHGFDDSNPRWGVFGREGRWLGIVEMPAGFTPLEFGEDYALGVTRDESGVEYVQLYSVTRR